MRIASLITALSLVMVAPAAYAETAPMQTQHMMQQLQQMLQKSGMSKEAAAAQQKKIQMGLVVLKMRGCVQETAGKEATDAFMNDIMQQGKVVEDLCQQGESSAARQQVLSMIKAKEHDPVARAARLCYQEHRVDIDTMMDKVSAEDLANYERWTNDPAAAEREMRDSDICKK